MTARDIFGSVLTPTEVDHTVKKKLREEFDDEVMKFYDSYTDWVDLTNGKNALDKDVKKIVRLKGIDFRYCLVVPTADPKDASFMGVVEWAWYMRGKELTERIERSLRGIWSGVDETGTRWTVFNDGRCLCDSIPEFENIVNPGYL